MKTLKTLLNSDRIHSKKHWYTLFDYYVELSKKKQLTKDEQSHKHTVLMKIKHADPDILLQYLHHLFEEHDRRALYYIIQHVEDDALLPALLYYLPKESLRDQQRNIEVLKNIVQANELNEDDIRKIKETMSTLEGDHITDFLLFFENHYDITLNNKKWDKKIGKSLYDLQL